MLTISLHNGPLIGFDLILEMMPHPHKLVLILDLEVHLQQDLESVNVVGKVEFLIKRQNHSINILHVHRLSINLQQVVQDGGVYLIFLLQLLKQLP